MYNENTGGVMIHRARSISGWVRNARVGPLSPVARSSVRGIARSTPDRWQLRLSQCIYEMECRVPQNRRMCGAERKIKEDLVFQDEI